MPKALITTVPFGEKNRLPLELLEGAGVDYVINPLGRRLKEQELAEMVGDVDVLIAGTEPITDRVMGRATKLKLDVTCRNRAGQRRFARRGATRHQGGLHARCACAGRRRADLRADADPASFGSRRQSADAQGKWQRHMGRRLAEVTVGIIGTGRIGARVLRRIPAFGTPRVLVNDIRPDLKLVPELKLEWVGKEDIYANADVISLHVPLTAQTKQHDPP